MKLKPVNDRILVRPKKDENEVQLGGKTIQIAGGTEKRPDRGVVIAVGPGNKDTVKTCEEGDEILYGKFAGEKIEDDEGDVMVLRFSDVIAVIEE